MASAAAAGCAATWCERRFNWPTTVPPRSTCSAALNAAFSTSPCSERGAETIRHFLFDVAKMTGDWKMEDVLEEEMEKIRQQVGWSAAS